MSKRKKKLRRRDVVKPCSSTFGLSPFFHDWRRRGGHPSRAVAGEGKSHGAQRILGLAAVRCLFQ